MTVAKLFAGHAIRRLRRANGLNQAQMAEQLDVSPSYLHLIERNQRPLTAAVILRLGDQFNFDIRALGHDEPGGGADAIRKRLMHPLFADLQIDRSELEEWLLGAPQGAEAFARAFDHMGLTSASSSDPSDPVRREIERWRNHFADLDAQAEQLSDELRLETADLYAAVSDRLRVRHQISIRILPVDVMPDRLRRLDIHARQLQLTELLDPASRTFSVAFQLAQFEAKTEIDALVTGAAFTERASERLFRRHLTSYFAAALIMPYSRFLRACEATGYDIPILERRFGANFEHVAHRLTTLQRVSARGLPFFMIRIDRAGQSSKRYAGASASPLVETDARCPLWALHGAFEGGNRVIAQLVELEDKSRWFTLTRAVQPHGGIARGTEFAIGLGVSATSAQPLSATRGYDLKAGDAVPIGLGCSACTRENCPQRSMPPAGRNLVFNERERGLTPFSFAGD